MLSAQIVVSLVFILIFVGILTEKIDKTLIVMIGSAFLIMFGYIGFEEAMHAIDFDTIVLLMGMMILVDCLKELKLFDWLSLRLGLFTKGNPVLIFVLFGLATAVASAFLDNVTTVLIMIPLTISLTTGIGLPPKVFILEVIFLSNIGGTATLIGDPPNILIGSQVDTLGFVDFIVYLGPPAVVASILAIIFLKRTQRATIKSRNDNFGWLFLSNLMLEQMKRDLAKLAIPKPIFLKAAAVFGLVLFGFFSHSITHLEPPVVALAGAAIMLLAFRKQVDLHNVIHHVEWATLLFFAGLFIAVGALEHAHVLDMIAQFLVSVTNNLFIMLMIVLWSSAILSAVVDNIPFVAVMIPILKDLMESQAYAGNEKAYLLWWALALGACFGGNGSQIGASANVISCAIANSRGVPIGFKEFAKESIPVTLLTMVIATIYISILYFV